MRVFTDKVRNSILHFSLDRLIDDRPSGLFGGGGYDYSYHNND